MYFRFKIKDTSHNICFTGSTLKNALDLYAYSLNWTLDRITNINLVRNKSISLDAISSLSEYPTVLAFSFKI